jgi:hypothetical protein
MKRFKDTPETACLYHFDRSFTWVDNLKQRGHLLTPDDDSANPGRARNALMNYWGAESGDSIITTGNQGLSGKEGDEALQVWSKPDRSAGAYSVMKWVFDGTPFEDLPELTDPWDDFIDYAWVEFYVKPFEKTTAHGNPDVQVVSRVVGVWSLELRIDPKTGSRGLQLIMCSDGSKVMKPNEGDSALWIPAFFEKQSLGRWHHVIIEYDKKNVVFRVDDVTREATVSEDLWRRKGTPWTFGIDKKGIGVNALFDEARMILRPFK